MKDIFDKVQVVLVDMWNYLYKFLAQIFKDDVGENVEPLVK